MYFILKQNKNFYQESKAIVEIDIFKGSIKFLKDSKVGTCLYFRDFKVLHDEKNLFKGKKISWPLCREDVEKNMFFTFEEAMNNLNRV